MIENKWVQLLQDKWQENVVDKMNTSEKQNYKQSLEIWSEVLEEKGFNNTPAADNVRNAIDVLDGELNSSNGQTLNNLNNNLDSILSMFFRKRYN